MTAEDVVITWLQGSGHTENQAKICLEHSKYQYLVTLIETMLTESLQTPTEEEAVNNALSTLYTIEEVRTLVNLIEKKLHKDA